jgi:hypothetical protein
MFDNRKRKDAEAAAALETIREELAAAELRSRAMLADIVAKMELRLSRDAEERRRLQSVTESAVETLQSSLTDNTTEMARALGQVANICALVAEQIDAERLERRAFTEAIARATRPPIPNVAGPSEIIGGTFFATSEVPDESEISLVDTNGDSAPDEPHIDTTSRVTPQPGTTIELSNEKSTELSKNGVHHQEVGDPRA